MVCGERLTDREAIPIHLTASCGDTCFRFNSLSFGQVLGATAAAVSAAIDLEGVLIESAVILLERHRKIPRWFVLWKHALTVGSNVVEDGQTWSQIMVNMASKHFHDLDGYLHVWQTGSETKAVIRKWMTLYNYQRPHSALGGKPPARVYLHRNDINRPDQHVQRLA